jgi:membrane-associated protease RseP (regulator of RpoE activity)
MRGVNLALFDFDYDLTWAAFFLNAHEKVYGRYSGRDADSAEGQVSLAGLRHAMQSALAEHRRDPDPRPTSLPARRTVTQFRSMARLPSGSCVHCHQVYDLRREDRQADGSWRLEDVWVYPRPENVGLTLDVDQGDRVQRVSAGSPAARAGLQGGDVLASVNGVPVASIADVQYGLHRAPSRGEVSVVWSRDGKRQSASLKLNEGWRKTDLSWRWSLRGLDPSPCVRGPDLDADDRKVLGLSARQLAFRQGPFVHPAAEQAGIRQNDVIVGVNDRPLEMTARQFQAYVRLEYQVGQRITFNVLRDGKPLRLTMKLPGRPK